MDDQIRYCASADGTTIGYIFREADRQPPLVNVAHSLMPLETRSADSPRILSILRLARERPVLSFDRRGVGYSQREASGLNAGSQLADLTAVISHAGIAEFDLIGVGDGCAVAAAYAALHPASIRRLGLVHPITRNENPGLSALVRENWALGRRAIVDALMGDMPQDERRLRIDILQRTVTPDVAAQYLDIGYSWQPGPELGSITAATLVVPPARAPSGFIDRARALAAMIPGARIAVAQKTPDTWDLLAPFLEGDDTAAPATGEQPSARTRGVTTVLFTDIVGHTEMMQRLGDARGRDVLREHERITRETLKQHGGAEVKTMGDGFLASFGSVTQAMECAIALQRALSGPLEAGVKRQGSGESLPPSSSLPEPLAIRVGLNAGEPIEEDGDLFGSTVILASRIASHAGACEILVPETVRGLLSGKGFLFADRGEFIARGFDEAVRIWGVRWEA